MSKQSTRYVLLIAGSCSHVGAMADVEAKMDEVVGKFVEDGWVKPAVVVRHQRGYVVQIWLAHKTRLNAKNLPAKLSVGIQEAEVV